MENQETVNPEAEVEVANETLAEQPQEAQEAPQEEDTMVPLHVVQKERRKRQEAEQEARFYKEQQQKAAEPEDDTRYESATKEDLGNSEAAVIRKIEEKMWKRQNPEKAQKIDEDLQQFLKLRPNLASAIRDSPNRYEEAWELMNALSPKQQQAATQKPKPEAPGSPSGVPKAAAMSENVDLMNMSDSEFNTWRQERRGRR